MAQVRAGIRRVYREASWEVLRPLLWNVHANVMFIGPAGNGKSTIANHLESGSNAPGSWAPPTGDFSVGDAVDAVTREVAAVSVDTSIIDPGRDTLPPRTQILISDTPGLGDREVSDRATINAIMRAFFISLTLPTVMVVVLRYGRLSRADRKALRFVFDNFRGSERSFIIVVNHADDASEEDYVQLLDTCKDKKLVSRLRRHRILLMDHDPDQAMGQLSEAKEVRDAQLRGLQQALREAMQKGVNAIRSDVSVATLVWRYLKAFFKKITRATITGIELSLRTFQDTNIKLLLGTCPICMNAITLETFASFMVCGHTVCIGCAEQLIRHDGPQARCPLDRRLLDP